ncbi:MULTISPECIES: hypothetical protein [Stenotrophomonas]|uniref:hypothetical protein n=1 Tax=Stenotrophomonas TaxID=40323 RepID=UPI00178539F8|nr:hypothetical protein [Stenotrophomonas sp. SXG-1]MCF3474862.1 hypothetical protein [Stenotrophomonas maltophilia]MCI1065545.1 hypothetical protein [Stenotrophomonas maltophilia]MCI1106665.1 hypothetical protein [Stenotrophomonas maltophilia]
MRTAWLLLCLPHAALAAPWLRSEGVATSAQGGVLYREVHWRREATEGAERWVLYQCPGGQPFARKHLPASTRPQARGYSLEDRRSGQAAVVDATGDSVSIAWKEDAASELRRRQLELPPDAVIDAGFDAAVRAHWPALLRGERISLPFLVPGRQRYFPVQVRRIGPVRWQGIDGQSIEVSLDTWYGGVAPRLSLVYANADRRLLEFRGTSNLRDARGSYPQVTVRFSSPAAERPASDWQRVWTQPLVDGCTVTPG